MRPLTSSTFVKVVGPAADETFDVRYLGRIGRVVGYSVEGDLAGVGDSPEDPAFSVRFAAGWGEPAHDNLFWSEELAPAEPPSRARCATAHST